MLRLTEGTTEEAMDDLRSHWDRVYTGKAGKALSWYQRHSSRSLAYVTAAATWASPIIDVGGGSSTLVDDLLERGYADVTVLDIAESALAQARSVWGSRRPGSSGSSPIFGAGTRLACTTFGTTARCSTS